jgi:hypothetical protein
MRDYTDGKVMLGREKIDRIAHWGKKVFIVIYVSRTRKNFQCGSASGMVND